MKETGTVYLYHFEKRLSHAGHYIGWTKDVDERDERHKNGRGSRLLSILNNKGIGYKVVRTWENKTRDFERKLKKRKESPRLCPICSEKGLTNAVD